MANKVRFGVSEVHYAFFDSTAQTQPAWGTAVAVPGAVKISVDENGNSNPFYADNGVYVELGSAGGLSGSIELALFPDSFMAEALGWEIDTKGALVEIAGAAKKPFALGFQVEGDEGPIRVWLYNVTLSRPAEDHNTTTDTIDVDTESADFTASSIVISNRKVVKSSITRTTQNATVFDAYLDSVTAPTFGA